MILLLSFGLAALWLVLVCLFVGVGALVLGEAATLEEGWPAAPAAFWTGMAAVTCGLLAWHLVLPADGWALAVTAVAAAAGWLRRRHAVAAWLRTSRGWALAVVPVVAVWVANHALDVPGLDDYLYEFQAVRWNHDFRIVPGLANLHGRLGFNESHHLLGAMLSVGPLAGRVNHVLNGLFVVATAAYLAGGIAQLLRKGPVAPPSCVVRGVLLGPVLGLALYTYYGAAISTLKADIIVTCAVLVIAALVVELAESAWGTAAFTRAATAVLAVCAFVLSVKLSAVIFAMVIAAGVAWALVREARHRGVGLPRPVRLAMVMTGVSLALVLARGTIISGYPAYPSTMGAVPVDWKVARAQADAERAIVTSWARAHPTYDPGEVAGWNWIENWARDILLGSQFTVVLPLGITLIAAAARGGRGRRRGRTAAGIPVNRGLRTLVAGCLAALAVWWVMAPSSRFAVGLFWGLAAASLVGSTGGGPWRVRRALIAGAIVGGVLLTLSFAIVGRQPGYVGLVLTILGLCAWTLAFGIAGRGRHRTLGVLCVVLALAESANRTVSFVVHDRRVDAAAVLWLTPARYLEDGSAGDAVVPRQTHSGLTVYVTSSTRYDTPLPNTRYFNPYLEARRPGSLASGFRAQLPPGVANYGYSVDLTRRRIRDSRD